MGITSVEQKFVGKLKILKNFIFINHDCFPWMISERVGIGMMSSTSCMFAFLPAHMCQSRAAKLTTKNCVAWKKIPPELKPEVVRLHAKWFSNCVLIQLLLFSFPFHPPHEPPFFFLVVVHYELWFYSEKLYSSSAQTTFDQNDDVNFISFSCYDSRLMIIIVISRVKSFFLCFFM